MSSDDEDLEISEPGTQFVDKEGDSEVLWEVLAITAERGNLYKVKWAGIDPKTKKPWVQTWVHKHDVTNDLVLEWKRKKARRKKKRESRSSNVSKTNRSSNEHSSRTGSRSSTSTAHANRRSTTADQAASLNWDSPPKAGPSRVPKRKIERLSFSPAVDKFGLDEKKPVKRRKVREEPSTPESEEETSLRKGTRPVARSRSSDSDAEDEPVNKTLPRPQVRLEAFPKLDSLRKGKQPAVRSHSSDSDSEEEPVKENRPRTKVRQEAFPKPDSVRKGKQSAARFYSSDSDAEDEPVIKSRPQMKQNIVTRPPAASPLPKANGGAKMKANGSSKRRHASDDDMPPPPIPQKLSAREKVKPRAPLSDYDVEAPASRVPFRRKPRATILRAEEEDDTPPSPPKPSMSLEPPSFEPVDEAITVETHLKPQISLPPRSYSPLLSPGAKARLKEWDECMRQIEEEERALMQEPEPEPEPAPPLFLPGDDDPPPPSPPVGEDLPIPTVVRRLSPEIVPETQSSGNTHSQESPQRPPTLISRMKPRTPSKSSLKAMRSLPIVSPSQFKPYLSVPSQESVVEDPDDSGLQSEVPEVKDAIDQFSDSSPERPPKKKKIAQLKRREEVHDDDGRDVSIYRRGLELADAARLKKPKQSALRLYEDIIARGNPKQSTTEESQERDNDELMELDELDPVALREEEEESTQDLVEDMTSPPVPIDEGWDMVQSVPEPMVQDSSQQPTQSSGHEADISSHVALSPEVPIPQVNGTELASRGWEHSPSPSPPPKAKSKSITPLPKAKSKTPPKGKEREDAEVVPPTPSAPRELSELPPSSFVPPSPDRGVQRFEIAQSLLKEKSRENERLQADLVAEQLRSRDLERQLQERLSVVPAPPPSLSTEREEELRQHIEGLQRRTDELQQELQESQRLREEEKKLSAIALRSAKDSVASAEKDKEIFREQYALASGFATSVREENTELEKRAKIAEEQASEGVALIRKTFEGRIEELQKEKQSWQDIAMFVREKDMLTNDDVRRRAAEYPELVARCDELEEDLEDKAEEVKLLKRQVRRKDAENKTLKEQVEKLGQELGTDVYQCQWRPEGSNAPCANYFKVTDDLVQHMFDEHLTLD